MKVKVKGIRCKHCGDFTYSRANHDYITCSCGKISVDGGSHIVGDPKSDYIRIRGYGHFEERFIGNFESIQHAKRVLYDDWNKRKNKYGNIKGEIVAR